MALTKYKLVNVPEDGVRRILPGHGLVTISEALTDEMADKLIQAGINEYFKKNDGEKGGKGDQGK